MYSYSNGVYTPIPPEQQEDIVSMKEISERFYWTETPYDDLVNNEIRKRYSASQEFSISRQRDRKPDEWNEYDSYCESCKETVRQKLIEYGMEAKINA